MGCLGRDRDQGYRSLLKRQMGLASREQMRHGKESQFTQYKTEIVKYFYQEYNNDLTNNINNNNNNEIILNCSNQSIHILQTCLLCLTNATNTLHQSLCWMFIQINVMHSLQKFPENVTRSYLISAFFYCFLQMSSHQYIT